MEPFIGQIMMFGGNFAPRGWAFCDGQLLPISQNSALFSILGTTYGGDGRTTFALPDLRGRVAIHEGNGPGLSDYRLGQKGGAETNTLTTGQMPSHKHGASATVSGSATGTVSAYNSSGDTVSPNGTLLAETGEDNFSSNAADVTMQADSVIVDNFSGVNVSVSVDNNGSGQSVNNIQPYLSINFVIALEGIYPSRS